VTHPFDIALGPADVLGLEIVVAGTVVRVAAVGELDLSNASVLEDAVRRVLEWHRPCRLVLDLRDLTFLDSSGLHLLCALAGDARAGDRRLTVVRGPDHVQRAIESVGLHEHLELVDDAGGVVDSPPVA
jgi:anti-sigma B factor antagonist